MSEHVPAAARREYVDKRLDEINGRQNNTDRAIGELQRKLDVAVTILERLDKRVGKE